MAHHAIRYAGIARPLGLLCSLVATGTWEAQWSVPLVAKRNGVPVASPKGYGSEKATKASEKSSLYLLPPPAAITTYCLPVFFPRNVIGVA